MGYKFSSPGMAGYPNIERKLAAAAGLASGVVPGMIAQADDKVFGGGEFIFARANGAIRQYGLCVLTPVWDATNLLYTINATECPNTANLGRALAVAQCVGAMASGEYGWFMYSGNTPVNGTATVAVDTTAGITAAGQIGANTAGKQILNARVGGTATRTLAKAATGLNGDTRINVVTTDGWWVGGYLSGTGVGASAIIGDIDPMGKYVIATVANSADIAGSVTQTDNNATIFYNVLHMNRAFAQGAIT